MFDLEAAAARMVASNSAGTKDFCFYQEDGLPHSGGAFHWYDTKEDLLNALVDDLMGFVFADITEGGFEEYLQAVRASVEGVRSGRNSLDSLSGDISQSIEDYSGGGTWRIQYVGSKSALFDEPEGFPFEIRKNFRWGSTKPNFDGSPIKEGERASFDALLADPMGFFD